MHQEPGNNVVEIGIDLTEFYLSVEWDILDVPATKIWKIIIQRWMRMSTMKKMMMKCKTSFSLI